MRKISAGATFVALGLGFGSTASAQLALKGSDTLDQVTSAVIIDCGLSAAINYVGGGSGSGQAAMSSVPATQHVSPMSRELNGATCVAGASSAQLMIGLDGISMVGANHTGADPFTCTDDIPGTFVLPVPGCTITDGCVPDGTYTFNSWKDVLTMIYGGMNNNTAAGAALIASGSPGAGSRNPARVNCSNPVRKALVENFALFTSNRGCNGTDCVRLNHVFRRDDLSGTTDAFQALTGLPALPGFATAFQTSPTSNATANAFCNAGTALMNKGDSDYLDLDPIRRPCKFRLTPLPRVNYEEVCEGWASPNNTDASCVAAQPGGPGAPTQIERSAWNGRGLIALSSSATDKANLTADLRAQGCLGLVLPISIPQTVASTSLYPTQVCTAGGFRAPTIPANGAICPDGQNPPCLLPAVDHSATGGLPTFDCYSDAPTPAASPKDARAFNTLLLDSLGHVLKDNFNNPNFVDPREPRVVRPFFRIHANHVDASTTTIAAATGGPCQKSDDTAQIGCLVKASPCSLGFAGREAVDALGPFQNFPFKIAGITPTNANIDAFVYPMARKLWFNSFVSGGVGFGPALSADELSLANCFGLGGNTAIIDAQMLSHNFRPVPAGLNPRLRSCPAGAP